MSISRIIYLTVLALILAGISAGDVRSHTIPGRRLWGLLIWVLAGHLTDYACESAAGEEIFPVRFGAGLGSMCAVIAGMTLFCALCRLLIGVWPFGGGDIKLLSIGALSFGTQRTAAAFCIAVVLAAPASFLLSAIDAKTRGKLSRKQLRREIAFSPFICAGFVAVCVYRMI